MTYRERLLEKCGFDQSAAKLAWKKIYSSEESPSAMHLAKWQHDQMHSILTALLDECERMAKVLEFYHVECLGKGVAQESQMSDDGFKAHQCLAAHATAMEKLCGEGE